MKLRWTSSSFGGGPVGLTSALAHSPWRGSVEGHGEWESGGALGGVGVLRGRVGRGCSRVRECSRAERGVLHGRDGGAPGRGVL